jgi:hypothetical protein
MSNGARLNTLKALYPEVAPETSFENMLNGVGFLTPFSIVVVESLASAWMTPFRSLHSIRGPKAELTVYPTRLNPITLLKV